MRDEFTSVVAAATVLIVGIYIVSSVYATMPASEFHKVENETVTADVGNVTQLSEAYGDHYYENETVYNDTDVKLTEGTDYEFYPGNASIKWYNSPGVNDGTNQNVTYSFDAKPESARSSITTIGDSFTLGAVGVIVVVASLIIGLIGGIGGSGGRGGRRL